MRRPAPFLLAAIGSTALAAVALARKLQAGTGSTPAEQAIELPGDEILPEATIQRTHAISIDASREQVWPWVAQLGQDRGGFYSYAALENLAGCRITNADTIHPQWQDVRLGDSMRLHPDMALLVARVEPGHALVARTSTLGPDGKPLAFQFTWAYVLRDEGTSGTRLLVRERYQPLDGSGRLTVQASTPLAALMTERMLRGIRDRAERTAHSAPTLPAQAQ